MSAAVELKTQRSYGLDLLRILSMLLVVVLHLLGAGGVLATVTPGYRYLSAWGLEVAASCAVNCYGLLSGYVGYGGRHSPKKLAVTWLQVAFLCAVFSWGVGWYFQGSLSWKDILFPLLPVITVRYWYFTAYFALYLLMPYLDRMLAGLDRKGTLRLTGILALLFSVIPFLAPEDIFFLNAGYSFLWLTCLYLLGACVKKLELEPRPAWRYALGYALCMALALTAKVGGDILSARFFPGFALGAKSVAYTSPLLLAGALLLLLLFAQMEVRGGGARKLISFFAPLSFGVYIIHTNGKVWTYLLGGHMAWAAGLSAPLLPLAVLGVAVAVFVVCALLDWLRLSIFRLLGLAHG